MRAHRKFLKPHHRFDDAFDRSMALLDDVVQVFDLPDPDRCFPVCVNGFECRQIRERLSTVIVSGAPF